MRSPGHAGEWRTKKKNGQGIIFLSLSGFDGVIIIIGAYQANWPSDKSHSHGVCHISGMALCPGMSGLV